MLKTIIIVIIMFELLIIGHEFGHFITAKKVGIKINEFSIGMGPALFRRQKGETVYALRAFPIGGYVAMEGEDDDSEDERSFGRKSIPAKCLVVAAGAIVNYLMAIVFLIIIAMIVGSPTTAVKEVVPGGAADSAGIRAGDVIVSIDSNPMESWTDITSSINSSNPDKGVSIQVERGDRLIVFDNVRASQDETGKKLIGIYAAYERNIFDAVKNGVLGSFDLIKVMFKSLKMLVMGEASVKDVVGPVGIVSVMDSAAAQGWIYVLYISALISVNLAIVNLLPFPALDGGRLLLLLIAGITGKQLSTEAEGRLHYLGFLLLMALMVLVTIKDVNQFIFK